MAKAIQAYLVLYNASCLVGWAYALYQGLTVLSGDVWPSLEGVWAVAGPTVLNRADGDDFRNIPRRFRLRAFTSLRDGDAGHVAAVGHALPRLW